MPAQVWLPNEFTLKLQKALSFQSFGAWEGWIWESVSVCTESGLAAGLGKDRGLLTAGRARVSNVLCGLRTMDMFSKNLTVCVRVCVCVCVCVKQWENLVIPQVKPTFRSYI